MPNHVNPNPLILISLALLVILASCAPQTVAPPPPTVASPTSAGPTSTYTRPPTLTHTPGPPPTGTASPTITLTRTPLLVDTPTPEPVLVDPRTLLEPGMYLAYHWREGLYLASLDGPTGVRLATHGEYLSPDGDHTISAKGAKIQLHDIATGERTPVEFSSASRLDFFETFSPAISPDLNFLAFAATGSTLVGDLAVIEFYTSIFITDLANGDTARLTPWDTAETHPAWSPDGAWLAFAADHAKVDALGEDYIGWMEIYLLDLSCLAAPETCGAAYSQLTDLGDAGFSDQPSWSPDSAQLAFRCNSLEIDEIPVISTTQGLATLTPTPPDAQIVEISPTVEITLTMNFTYTQGDICVADIASGGVYTLTNTRQVDEFQPLWSPDGLYIAFSYSPIDPPRSSDIYLIPPGGGEPVNLTNTPFDDERAAFWIVIR